MIFGSNAKYVYETILKFLATRDSIEPKLTPPRRNSSEFSDFMYLLFIVNGFILEGDFDEEKIFNLIHDEYNAEDGIYRFIRYRESLKKEEEKFGLQNLAFILKTKLELREKKKTD